MSGEKRLESAVCDSTSALFAGSLYLGPLVIADRRAQDFGIDTMIHILNDRSQVSLDVAEGGDYYGSAPAKSNKKKWIIGAVVAIVVLVAIGLGVGLTMGGGKDETAVAPSDGMP
jgi:hypothetical protein